MKLAVVILTFNEAIHIERCIASVCDIADDIYVIDSNSTDNTVDLAKKLNAKVLTRNWTNHSDQFNWALTQLSPDTTWVLRIDADEYLTEELHNSISVDLPNIQQGINGIYLGRRMKFLGRTIKHGGVFPVKVLRLFRFGKGECESRWMDEHIVVNGETAHFNGEIIDDNLNSLTWWIEKHNKYSSLEAVEMLNLELQFLEREGNVTLDGFNQTGIKRWLKEKIYFNLPSGFRSFLYFFYRYVIRLGFLDGREGSAFHFLQGFWYRYLVDSKVLEVKRYIQNHHCDVVTAIDKVLGVQVKNQ